MQRDWLRQIPSACWGVLALTLVISARVWGVEQAESEPTASSASTATALRAMSVADVAKLHSVVDASIAPNGEWIAYRQAVPRDPLKDADGSSWVELHVSDLNGHSRPYVTGKLNVGTMAWSPDSQRIYYLARRHDDSSTSLYCIPLNGGESRRVLTHATGIGDFAISPDGTQVAFLATEEMDESVKKLKDQGFNQEIYEEDLRPTRVWLAELSEDAKSRMLDIAGSAHDIGWNPARSELYVVTSPTPTVDDSYMFKQIKIVDVRTGHELSSVLSPGKLGQVEWSPDGRRLAMIAGSDLYDPQEGRLKVIAVPGPQEPIDLMPDDEAHVASFVWQDDKTLLWIADDRQYTTLGRVTMRDEGTADERQVLVEGPGPVMSSLSLADQGGVACVLGNTAQHPNEVFRLNVDEPSLHRLTNSNDGLSKIKFAEQSVVKWQARDGMEIEGVLIKPLEYVEGRRYPMIMVVHGGPESHVADGWVTNYSNPGQVGAARGFAVFYPNYRGSTGRGVEFSKLGQADAAGKEFDDLVDGVDHLIETGLVERNRVGITGGSYGGYASAWGATYYSERFAASVMFVGISNNVSKLGTTDIPEEMYLVHHRKRLWDDVNYFLDRSPIRYVERHRTPTLILHGKQDPRVHPSQSLELFRHLKTLDQAPVRLVLYEGEGHGNRRATSRLDYQLRQLRWMEHYLMGPGGKAPPMELDYEAALSK